MNSREYLECAIGRLQHAMKVHEAELLIALEDVNALITLARDQALEESLELKPLNEDETNV